MACSKELSSGERFSLVLIGKTGQGKSETGNSILGKDFFETSDDTTSCTSVNKLCEAKVLGHEWVVVDTPGCMDTEKGEKVLEEIAAAVLQYPDGYDAFLMVFKYPMKLTEEELKTIKELEKIFGEEMYDHAVVIFTHGDAFENKQKINRRKNRPVMKFKEYVMKDIVSQNKHSLGPIIQDVGKRVMLFNNATPTDEEKNQRMLDLIEMIKSKPKKGKYTNFIFKKAQQLNAEHPGATRKMLVSMLLTFLKTIFVVSGGVITVVAAAYDEARRLLG